MAITLLYHDVVPVGGEDVSGFPGPGAARYKVTPTEFTVHLEAVARALRSRAVLTVAELPCGPLDPSALLWTFDDGGVSAFSVIADALERHGWRGHFFVTTDYLDTPTFVSRSQVRDLHRRGHVIGSHSASHPTRMALCPWDQLVREWRDSCAVLADVIGEPVTVASVPGGFYSRAVAQAAALAGVKILFNSEPTSEVVTVAGCRVLGRYTVYRGMSAAAAAGLAAGRLVPCLSQALLWNVKKLAKVIGGRLYLSLRSLLLRRAYGDGPSVRS